MNASATSNPKRNRNYRNKRKTNGSKPTEMSGKYNAEEMEVNTKSPSKRIKTEFKGSCHKCGESGHKSYECTGELSSKSNDLNAPKVSKMKSVSAPASAASSSNGKKSFVTNFSFDSLKISNASKRGISEVLGYEYLTQVQHLTLPSILDGKDVLAQAKTGTGKTLAFLIPAVEVLLKSDLSHGKFGILILSSTRELALQIEAEAKSLIKFQPDFRTLCVVGGTNIKTDQKRAKLGAAILVATPGRLIDHMQNTPGFSSRCSDLRVLILDEADQLLEQGFQPAIKTIVSFLPSKTTRQNLLFSATVPEEVKNFTHLVMSDDYLYINAIPKGEEHTHKAVPQYLLTCTVEEELSVLISLLKHHMSSRSEHKVIVFFTTARLCQCMAEIGSRSGIGQVLEIHSRKSQSARTKTSDQFRKGSNLILFSSDVSARGVDYPDVSLVLQVGLTEKAQYIHRLGRTARGSSGVEGVGILLVKDFESKTMKNYLSDLPIQVSLPADMQAAIQRTPLPELQKAIRGLGPLIKGQAYQAWIGFHNTHLKKFKWTKDTLVVMASRFAQSIDAIDRDGRAPGIQKRTIGKMGLKGVNGLYIV